MINQEFKADLIEVIEKGGFKTNHTFQVADEKLGVLELNGIKSAGVFKAENGQELVYKKTSPWKSTYELSENGTQTGFASSRKTLRQDYYDPIPGRDLWSDTGRFQAAQLESDEPI